MADQGVHREKRFVERLANALNHIQDPDTKIRLLPFRNGFIGKYRHDVNTHFRLQINKHACTVFVQLGVLALEAPQQPIVETASLWEMGKPIYFWRHDGRVDGHLGELPMMLELPLPA